MIDFDKLVESHIAREHKPRQVGRYFPSEVGNCMRKLWYSYKYPKEVDIDVLKIFEVGNIMHGFVTRVFRSEKNKGVKLLKSEFPIDIREKDFTISGRVDGLLLVKAGQREVLIEVKSAKDVSLFKKPHSSHVMQLLFYMLATKVHEGFILYVDKNNLSSKIFEVPFDEEKAKRLSQRFNDLHVSLVFNELPAAEAKVKDDIKWMCKYCEYKDKCDKNEK